ncbi:MAG: NAD(P) transhydrogenase subunit alpha [Alphaproteobacteria bacterium]|nr:NAD(P) transhydrogenase subunit alpha [Alphaproteobacteria bacterium]
MLKSIVCLAATCLVLVPPAFAGTGGSAVDPITFRIAIFVLAIFVGYYVVWSVTPALHTPLMAVTNAISSVIIVGALIAAAAGFPEGAGPGSPVVTETWIAKGLGGVAVALASVNIFGGFLVTQRMLAMYKKKDRLAAKPGVK